MKVLLINGSPRKAGCTFTALSEVAKTLNEENIETEIFHIGDEPIAGCISCRACRELGKCVKDDIVNKFAGIAKGADGFVFGSPVYYAGINGSLACFMDRLFFSDPSFGSGILSLKPAACVVSARRAGTTAALDQLMKYSALAQMPIITSRYWNMVHGNTPEEVMQDLEGLQIMRCLARNMAWFLKCKEAGIKAGIPFPKSEERIATNFIR